MLNEFQLYAPQGWQCPVCGRVYSPTTSMCFYCGNQETITTTVSSYPVETGASFHYCNKKMVTCPFANECGICSAKGCRYPLGDSE